MGPLVISFALFAATVAAATMLGGLVFIGIGQLLRARIDEGRAFGGAFVASFVSAAIYAIVLKVLDHTDQPLLNTAFFIGVAAGIAVSFLCILKSFEVEPKHVPMLWLPFAAILGVAFYFSRTAGDEWREKNGFYRGYESISSLMTLDPPDAMSTPEKAINFYNLQYKKLRNANEDEGIGKLFTTATHWDAKWFNDNFPYITQVLSKSDPFGITKVVQDPKQHKVMSLAHLARPIYGKIKDVKTDGNEAVVLMDSGELVRLHKEGKNWKVRDWLGMRPIVMREIYDIKEKNSALTAEDRAAKETNFNQYENDTRTLASKLGLPYSPYNPYEDEDEESGKKKSGYAALDNAKPNELVDLTAQPSPTPAMTKEEETRRKLAVLNNQMDAQMASAQGKATPVGAVTIEDEKRDPNAMKNAIARVQLSPTPVSVVPTFIPGIDVSALWPDYFQAIAKIERGDTNGIKEFLKCITSDDSSWFQRNYGVITDLVTPGAQYTPEQSQLVALQALARSMPHVTNLKPVVKTTNGLGLAKFVEGAGGAANTYVTMVQQENGRWVLSHPFFARTFVWVPQIAAYKQTHGIALSADEQSVLASGVGPLQRYVQKVYQQIGFTP